jgi:hypothetical protein
MIFSMYEVSFNHKNRENMKTTKISTSFNHHLEYRFNLLMKIRDFKEDLNLFSEKIRSLSERLIQEYSTGLIFLGQHVNLNNQEKAEKILDHIRVYINLMNQALPRMDDSEFKIENSSTFSFQAKSFNISKDKLFDYSRIFERFGKKYLGLNEIKIWEVNFGIFDEKYAKSFDKYAETIDLISKLFERFTPYQIEFLTKIITENQDLVLEYFDTENHEVQNMKVIAQLKRELNSQNMWNKFLEVLSGDSPLSAEEKWIISRWKESDRSDA